MDTASDSDRQIPALEGSEDEAADKQRPGNNFRYGKKAEKLARSRDHSGPLVNRCPWQHHQCSLAVVD